MAGGDTQTSPTLWQSSRLRRPGRRSLCFACGSCWVSLRSRARFMSWNPCSACYSWGGVRVLSGILAESVHKDATPGKEVILIGAGAAAQMTIWEIGRPGSGYRAVACVDDDRSKTGIKIHGVPVIGTLDELRTFAANHAFLEFLLSVLS